MSCLFNSLSYFVGEGPQVIRNKICDFLEKDEVLFDTVRCSDATQWEQNSELSKYVSSMRSPSVWGGAIEIKAFCELWNISVEVYSSSCRLVASFVPSTSSSRVVKLRWTGSHYDPIREDPDTVFTSSSGTETPSIPASVVPWEATSVPQPPPIRGRSIKFRVIDRNGR